MPLRLSVSPASSQPGTSAVVEEPKKKRGRKPKRVASPIAEEGSPTCSKSPQIVRKSKRLLKNTD